MHKVEMCQQCRKVHGQAKRSVELKTLSDGTVLVRYGEAGATRPLQPGRRLIISDTRQGMSELNVPCAPPTLEV